MPARSPLPSRKREGRPGHVGSWVSVTQAAETASAGLRDEDAGPWGEERLREAGHCPLLPGPLLKTLCSSPPPPGRGGLMLSRSPPRAGPRPGPLQTLVNRERMWLGAILTHHRGQESWAQGGPVESDRGHGDLRTSGRPLSGKRRTRARELDSGLQMRVGTSPGPGVRARVWTAARPRMRRTHARGPPGRGQQGHR